jgi:phage tail-like protein
LNTLNPTPHVPGPPHDPTFWLLDARAGWHDAILDNVEVSFADQFLTLAQVPGSGRSLSEASGAFGGLTLPSNVARGPDGSTFLLDQQTAVLKRFDPCECKFEIVPRLGGAGKGPWQLSNPNGLGICGGNIFICDTGNHRLSVFALRGFVLRAHWAPPATAGLINEWEPFAVGFDGRGRVFVTDPANGCIHRFHPSGRWETSLAGFGRLTHLAIDCRDHLYVLDDTNPAVARVVDVEGRDLGVISRVDQLVSLFPRLSFPVDAEGNLHLGEHCAVPGSEGVFDLTGSPRSAPPLSGPAYHTSGTFLSRALDSKLYRCQWHRLILRGKIPAGSRVLVETYTAEADESIVQIQNLPDELWETKQHAGSINAGEWDCLVRNGGGRFLWLRLRFTSRGVATPVIESVRVEFPRISPRRFLPAVFGGDPVSADFTDRFLSVFDTILRSVESQVDQQGRLFDPLSAPASQPDRARLDFLTWLGTWIGFTADRHWPEPKRRKLLQQATRLYPLRGTREGLWRQLLLLLDLNAEQLCCRDDRPQNRCTPLPSNCARVEQQSCAWQPPPLILEHFQLRRWLFLGTGRLGDQAIVWGKRIANRSQLDNEARVGHTELKTTQDPYRDPFHYYAYKFTVFVPARYQKSDELRKALENLLRAERPAYTRHYVEFVAPRFRIGVQSMIGLDSVVGCYPQGVTLDQSTLGGASILSAPPYKQGRPSFEVGDQSRIGSTTQLE